MIVLSLSFRTFADESSETLVTVEGQHNLANVGEAFTINVTVFDVQNLYGLEIALVWNQTILKLANVDVRLGQTYGVLYNPIYFDENSKQGSYIIQAASMNPAPSFNGTGNIVQITFEVVNIGFSQLDLSTKLYDYPPADRDPRVSLPIPHTTIDGFCEAVVSEFSIPFVLLIVVFLTLVATIFSSIRKRRFAHQD